ncbi:MAG: hypothetical protein OXB93_00820 [Cytophagales bacterium]|nr:hypothetical protein [Cytophagales bacterium]
MLIRGIFCCSSGIFVFLWIVFSSVWLELCGQGPLAPSREYDSAPTLTGFSPSSGQVASEIVLRGTGFSPILRFNHVYIGPPSSLRPQR